MGYFIMRQDFFLCCYASEVEKQSEINQYLSFLERSGIGEILKNVKPRNKPLGGRPEYNRYDLFAMILYGFAYTSGSLRDIEAACVNDLRFITLMRGEKPSYKVIGNYINDYIVPNTEEIFGVLIRRILKECQIETDDVFIDGTKIEANANKYKFVWKPTTYHHKLSDKIRELLDLYKLRDGIPAKGIIPSKQIAEKLTEFSRLVEQDGEADKKLLHHYDLLKEYLEKALDYEEKERICGPDRNSYYKSDHDATAMALKEDYYSGLGSNMHAAYNVQVAVCKGIVCGYNVSQSRTDLKELIPIMEQFFRIHKKYPKNLCADAGYGSLENYKFLQDKEIGNYVKYMTWEGNVSGRNPSQYRLNEDNTITCLNGKTGYITEIPGRHHKKKDTVFYKVTGCRKCVFSPYCKRWQKKKSENFKTFEVLPELQNYIQQAEENLLSPKGIEIRVNRSCQVEGSYGVLKQDMNYIRFRRTSLRKVTAEYMLTFMGYNIRKLFRFFRGNLKTNYWIVPAGLEKETFKKPNAKRLSNKVLKKKNKTANQKAKKSYKYKKKGAV